MEKEFDLQKYMAKGIEHIVADAIKSTLSNPLESAFMVKFGKATVEASKKRAKAKENGENIPPFLIASITSSCNLHCEGCYSRHNHATVDGEPKKQLMGDEWGQIFEEADELGISFILLAGGEPLLRKDVITAASNVPNILFPIFTNGTFMNDSYLELFSKKRNLMPVLSIEGDKDTTDNRRGEGVYDKLIDSMDAITRKGIVFGASITVTTKNIDEVTSKEFLDELHDRGCKLVVYVEYVPVNEESSELAPTDIEREIMKERIALKRKYYKDVIFLSFPGDEKDTGGCIAAGRGFFHINSHGDAEACPFSPYSDINVKDASLRKALKSRLFTTLRNEHYLDDDHIGGCVLFEKRKDVERILASS